MSKKMKHLGNVFLLSMIMFSLLLSGCGTIGQRKGTTPEGEPYARQVYMGTKGLEMQFMKDIPSTIFEGSPINLLIELRNLGTYEITGGRLFLGGYEPTIIPIIANEKTFNLDPKSQFNIDGGFDTVDFASNTVRLPFGTDSYKPKFVLTACYEYRTSATPVICVDPVPQLGTMDKACKPGAVPVAGGQGAPVAVSGIYVEALPGKSRVKVDISNVGGGRVVNFRNCPYNLQYSDLNYVQYRITLAGARPDCKPTSPLKLVDGRATVYCTFDISGETAYTTPLSIELTYDYMNSISKDIEIRSIG